MHAYGTAVRHGICARLCSSQQLQGVCTYPCLDAVAIQPIIVSERFTPSEVCTVPSELQLSTSYGGGTYVTLASHCVHSHHRSMTMPNIISPQKMQPFRQPLFRLPDSRTSHRRRLCTGAWDAHAHGFYVMMCHKLPFASAA